MALNAISTLAPALVPVVVKLIDNFFSSDDTVTPPEIREKRQRYKCCCKTRDSPSLYNSNECNACGRPYPIVVLKKDHLNIPINKPRSMSSSEQYSNINKVNIKNARRDRCLSDGYQKRVTDVDTLVQLHHRLRMN